MEERVHHRQPEVDIAFINAKTRLAITVAIGGMVALVVGLVVVIYGGESAQSAVFRFGGIEVSASGIGAVIVATSVMWAYIAYKVRPTYSASHRITRKVLSDGSEEYQHSMDTTQTIPTADIQDALAKRKQNT